MAKIDMRRENIRFKLHLMNEEYAKLVHLPDEEFFSPDAMEKRSELRKKMLAAFKELDKPEWASKYFEKHYQVEEAELDKKQCYHCKKIFGIDYKWLEYFTKDCDPDWVKCICPYCGTKLQWHV